MRGRMCVEVCVCLVKEIWQKKSVNAVKGPSATSAGMRRMSVLDATMGGEIVYRKIKMIIYVFSIKLIIILKAERRYRFIEPRLK